MGLPLRLFFLLCWLPAAALQASPAAEKAFDAGQAALFAGQYDAAIVHFTEAIKIDPKSPFAYNGRGITYQHKKKYDLALAAFNESIRLKPMGLPYYNRCAHYYDKGDPKSTIALVTPAF